jgi:hypothetical protein
LNFVYERIQKIGKLIFLKTLILKVLMGLPKSVRIVYSKPPETPDFEKKEIIYQCISEMRFAGKHTRIGDIAEYSSRKYAGKIEFDSVKTASLIFQLESTEKRVESYLEEIDGLLYFMFAPVLKPLATIEKKKTELAIYNRELGVLG